MKKIYYKEFDDLLELNEWIEVIGKSNVININYVQNKHCLYFWQ